GPFLQDGDGCSAMALGDVVVADAGIAAAEDPEVIAILGEIGPRPGSSAEEIEGGRGDGDFAVAGGHDLAIGVGGLELAAGLHVDYASGADGLRRGEAMEDWVDIAVEINIRAKPFGAACGAAGEQREPGKSDQR